MYRVFDDAQDAGEFIDDFGEDVVIKPVGLTGGKGVKIMGNTLRMHMKLKITLKR